MQGSAPGESTFVYLMHFESKKTVRLKIPPGELTLRFNPDWQGLILHSLTSPLFHCPALSSILLCSST